MLVLLVVGPVKVKEVVLMEPLKDVFLSEGLGVIKQTLGAVDLLEEIEVVLVRL